MKTVNAILLGLVVFLLAYCACFYLAIMPKFYPVLGRFTLENLKGQIAVKFVGSAVVGMVAGLIALAVGRFVLPESPKVSRVMHLLFWATLVVAFAYLAGRETDEYICKFLPGFMAG
jgi:hypothetical protein